MVKPTMWFPNRFDTNQAIQALKRARGWKLWIHKKEKLYYPCSENKGADQLRGYVFVFPMQIVGFPMRRLVYCRSIERTFLIKVSSHISESP